MKIENQVRNPAISPSSKTSNIPRGADFQARLSATQQASQPKDSVSLSVGSYEQRLRNLKKLHAETDYSGLSDLDKGRLIYSRFEEAFPDIHAIFGGLYLYAGEHSIYTDVMDELERQETEVFSAPLSSNGVKPEDNVKYLFGYGGLSDDEIRAKVNEKYSGGMLADKCGALRELTNMGLDDGVGIQMLHQIQMEMVQGTEAKYGKLDRDNPLRVNAMISYATGTKMNWTQLARASMDFVANNTYKRLGYTSEEIKREILADLGPKFDRFLDNMLHTEKEGRTI